MNKKNSITVLLASCAFSILYGTAPVTSAKKDTAPAVAQKVAPAPTSTPPAAETKKAPPDPTKQLEAENSALKAQLKTHEKTIAKLTGEISTLKDTMSAHEDVVKTIEKKNSALEKQITQLEAQLAKTKSGK